MNSSINVWKFIFSVLIVILHINVVFNTGKLQGMYIFADWFYVFAGYTLAKRIEKIDKNADTFVESCIIIRDYTIYIFIIINKRMIIFFYINDS